MRKSVIFKWENDIIENERIYVKTEEQRKKLKKNWKKIEESMSNNGLKFKNI